MQIYFHSHLCSYLLRVPILVEGTVDFGARVPPSCDTTVCDVAGLVRSMGQRSNISILKARLF